MMGFVRYLACAVLYKNEPACSAWTTPSADKIKSVGRIFNIEISIPKERMDCIFAISETRILSMINCCWKEGVK